MGYNYYFEYQIREKHAMMKYDLKSIMSNFDTRGNFASAHRYGSGHIHDTFLVHTTEESSLDYLLQRINHHVFRNVPQLMSNIERVTKHIQKKISQSRDSDFSLECLSFVPAKDGKYYYRDPRGNYWRVCVFIPESSSYDMVDSPDRAYAGGKAFGRFLALVADLSADSLYETIPDFLDMEKRLDKFYEVLKRDPVKRAKEVPDETSIVKTREEEMKCINRLGREGKIPKRVTHNDTKFNNILFDSHHNPLCVIDLDTVMPGYIHYDFGDAIRTVANTGAEDEENLEEVHMDMGLFEAFSEGFLQETKSFLVEAEIDYLAFSAKSLTFMAGLRFLTDFLDGDHYYKIDHEYHNLQRTRAQWKLLESMDEQYAEMQAVIKKIARS